MNLKYKLEAAKITKLARNEPFDVKKWNNKVKTSKEANQIVGLVNMRFRVVMNSFHCKLGILSSIFNVSFQIEEKREISKLGQSILRLYFQMIWTLQLQS